MPIRACRSTRWATSPTKSAAWQEVARRVAHEIKNPLTPIQLSIQRIKRKSAQGAPAVEETTALPETETVKDEG